MKKRIWILTMFKDYFDTFLDRGVIARALGNERRDGLDFEVHLVSIPEFCKKGFKGVDDSPFGGGVGMIMRADVLKNAFTEGVLKPGGYHLEKWRDEIHFVFPAPRGKIWCHDQAISFAEKNLSLNSKKDLVFLCGRYEGVDERFLENYIDEYISLGDYILTGGELATMIILDSSLRFSDGVLGNKLSAQEESFVDGKLEHALYTRPQEFEGKAVPDELLSGDPKKIDFFKKSSSKKITQKYRPDLLGE